MEFRTSPTWPPGPRWLRSLLVVVLIASLFPALPLYFAGASTLVIVAVCGLFFVIALSAQIIMRKMRSSRPRTVKVEESTVQAMIEAIRREDREMIKAQMRVIAGQVGLNKQDADSVFTQLIERENPSLARRMNVLD